MDRQFVNGRDIRKQTQYQQPKQQVRSGMSDGMWGTTLFIIEVLSDIMKAIMVVGGVLAANLADVTMGAIAISILFGGAQTDLFGTPAWVLGAIISMGASAIQIYLWSLLQKRNIGLKEIWRWNKLPGDLRTFLGMALFVWAADTFIDVSPIALLVQNSQYQSVGWLYYCLVFFVGALVFVLCGFAEILTTNMRSMLMTTHTNKQNNQDYNNQDYQQRSNFDKTQKQNVKIQPKHKPQHNIPDNGRLSTFKNIDQQYRQQVNNRGQYDYEHSGDDPFPDVN